MVAAAQFQSERRFGSSLALAQSPNLVLLLAAVVTLAAGVRDARLPLLLMAAGWFPLAIWGWRTLLAERHAKPARDAEIPWGEALAFAGMAVTGLLMIQLERLVLPHVLPPHDLATFGVLGAIAGSLFRVLQMGVGYTLMPRLREAETVRLRRKLVAREARLVGVVVLVGSAAIWVLTPWIEQLLLGGEVSPQRRAGLRRPGERDREGRQFLHRAAAAALATARELWVANVLGWLAVVVAVAAGVVGARWGLAGVIYGVTVGWVLRSVPTFWYAARHLRLAGEIPVGQPAVAPLEDRA